MLEKIVELEENSDDEELEVVPLTRIFLQLLRESLGITLGKGKRKILENIEVEDETETGERDDFVIGTNVIDWSDDALEFKAFWNKSLRELEEETIFSFFTHLNLVGRKISEIDLETKKFASLKNLSLSANAIQKVENLPINLEILNIHGNQISEIDKCNFPKNLVHLGIAHSRISKISFQSQLSNLISLDLSFNNISSLKESVGIFTNLPKLKQLVLLGNPISYVTQYRIYCAKLIPTLVLLDDQTVSDSERNKAKVLDLSSFKEGF